jgi:hypothetical protein
MKIYEGATMTTKSFIGKLCLACFLLVVTQGWVSAQPVQTVIQQPDCLVFFQLTSASSSGNIDNRQRGCTNWSVTYTSSGFTGLTLAFQSSSDTAGTPTSFGTFAGTVLSGSNPSTAITEAAATYSGYYPWLRVNLSGLTGTGTTRGMALGWKANTQSLAIVGAVDANIIKWGGVATTLGQKAMAASVPVVVASDQSNVPVSQATASALNATVAQPTASLLNAQVVGVAAAGAALSGNPVRTGVSDGTNVQNVFSCPSRAAVSTAASGSTQIVALSGGKIIYVCGTALTAASAVTISLVSGTGADCVTGPTTIAGAYSGVTSMVLGYPQLVVKSVVSEALCINLGGAVAVSGEVFYGQF